MLTSTAAFSNYIDQCAGIVGSVAQTRRQLIPAFAIVIIGIAIVECFVDLLSIQTDISEWQGSTLYDRTGAETYSSLSPAAAE